MRPTLFAAVALLLASVAPAICQGQVADLEVRVTGAKSQAGTVEVSLFNSAETFMREPFLQMVGHPVDEGEFAVDFVAIPTGEYAIAVVHDENGNGKLDNGLFGIGGEGYGFSNDVRPLLGWPDFEDAAFEVREDTVIEIELD